MQLHLMRMRADNKMADINSEDVTIAKYIVYSIPYLPDHLVEWNWKLSPYLFHGLGHTITIVLLYELIIAQSLDKMKGLII